MSKLSVRDYELISAYLDRELSQKEKTRLVARIVKDPDLARALDELRQTRAMLRQTPHRKAPRNFTLTPKMAGIRPPVPRVVPALSWASAVAIVMFVFTLGYNFLSSSVLPASQRAADTYGSVAATSAPATQAPATQPPATQAPAAPLAPIPTKMPPNPTATQNVPGSAQRPSTTATAQVMGANKIPPTPVPGSTEEFGLGGGSGTSEVSPTPGINSLTVPGPATQSIPGVSEMTTPQNPQPRAFPWAYIWLGLAALCIGAALLIRWLNRLAFAHKTKH